MTFEHYSRLAPRLAQQPLTPAKIASAYHFPVGQYAGAGETIAVIELDGAFIRPDFDLAMKRLGVNFTGQITPVYIDGAKENPDGVNGATGEVALDTQVIAALAPRANQNIYFAPNTDKGFYDAAAQAIKDGCTAISISWGGPESSWVREVALQYNDLFGQGLKAGVITFCASGDRGAKDGTKRKVADFPASSQWVLACGGTTLYVDANGARAQETGWSDNPVTSASGGGVSGFFAGRHVPDISGNADPDTGWPVVVDGKVYTFGGTSAVAPMYAALTALLSEAVGAPLGTKVDLKNTLLTNLGVLYDVVSGDNRVGLGRDDETGLGVVDGAKVLKVLKDTIGDPAPVPVDPGQPVLTDGVDLTRLGWEVATVLDEAKANIAKLISTI